MVEEWIVNLDDSVITCKAKPKGFPPGVACSQKFIDGREMNFSISDVGIAVGSKEGIEASTKLADETIVDVGKLPREITIWFKEPEI